MSRARTCSSQAAAISASAKPDESLAVDNQGGVAARLGQRSGAGGDHRRTGCHRLQTREPEALVARRHCERHRARVETGEVGLVDVAQTTQSRVRSTQVAAVRACEHQLDPALAQAPRRLIEGLEVLAGRHRPDREGVRTRQAVTRRGRPRIGVGEEALVDALGDHRHPRRRRPEDLDHLAPRELRHGDQGARVSRQPRQQAPLVFDVRPASTPRGASAPPRHGSRGRFAGSAPERGWRGSTARRPVRPARGVRPAPRRARLDGQARRAVGSRDSDRGVAPEASGPSRAPGALRPRSRRGQQRVR